MLHACVSVDLACDSTACMKQLLPLHPLPLTSSVHGQNGLFVITSFLLLSGCLPVTSASKISSLHHRYLGTNGNAVFGQAKHSSFQGHPTRVGGRTWPCLQRPCPFWHLARAQRRPDKVTKGHTTCAWPSWKKYISRPGFQLDDQSLKKKQIRLPWKDSLHAHVPVTLRHSIPMSKYTAPLLHWR
jgi:hypothetical protein